MDSGLLVVQHVKQREGSAVSGAFFDEHEHFSTFFMRFLEND